MFLSQLRENLGNFKPEGTVTIAVPTASGEHDLRAITTVGHIGHEGVRSDLALDIQTEPWDVPAMARVGRALTVGDLLKSILVFPDEMHVRVAVPLINHESHSWRMLDIHQIGFTVGTGQGAGIQIITENWDLSAYQIIRTRSAAEE
jgi:hypothetical protein